MAWRSVPFVKEAALVAAAFLLAIPPARAGDKEHGATRRTPSAQSAHTHVVRAAPQPAAISVVVTTPARPAQKPVYVDLLGPDGQVRRFLVEGGRAAIQFQQVVLRPGQSLTIRWLAAK